jgi:uncharacterized protein YbjT (DUF2867 family)
MYSPFMQYNEVFVTGGTGPLGIEVCRALLGQRFLPRLLARLGSEWKIPPDIRERCRVTPGDVTVRESVEMGIQGTMAVVHLAGAWKELPRMGITFEKEHVRAAANILQAASAWKIGRMVYVSVAGARPGDAERYLDAKGRAEAMVRDSDLSWTVFRPTPWYDLRSGKPRVSPEYLKSVAVAVADSIHRKDTVGRIYEGASTERFPWEESPKERATPTLA